MRWLHILKTLKTHNEPRTGRKSRFCKTWPNPFLFAFFWNIFNHSALGVLSYCTLSSCRGCISQHLQWIQSYINPRIYLLIDWIYNSIVSCIFSDFRVLGFGLVCALFSGWWRLQKARVDRRRIGWSCCC